MWPNCTLMHMYVHTCGKNSALTLFLFLLLQTSQLQAGDPFIQDQRQAALVEGAVLAEGEQGEAATAAASKEPNTNRNNGRGISRKPRHPHPTASDGVDAHRRSQGKSATAGPKGKCRIPKCN